MSLFEVWKASISAQKATTSLYSDSFHLRFIEHDSNSHLNKFEIKVTEPIDLILPKLKESFPAINEENIALDKGYLVYDSYAPVHDLKQFEIVSNENWFDFSSEPCFSGEVNVDQLPYDEIKRSIDVSPDENGDIHATLSTIHEIDEFIANNIGYSRRDEIAALFKVSPSESYSVSERNLALQYLSETVGPNRIFIKKDNYEIGLKNTFLVREACEGLRENSTYQRNHHKLYFRISSKAFSEFEKERKSKRIFYSNENIDNQQEGVILPTPIGETFVITLGGHVDINELRDEIQFHSKAFERYFPKEDIDFNHFHIFRHERTLFYERLRASVDQNQFNVGLSSEIIAFNFCNEAEFETKFKSLNQVDIAKIEFHGDDHRYKVNLMVESPLEQLLIKLKEIPSVSGFITDSGRSLRFTCTFRNQVQQPLLEGRISDVIGEYKPKKGRFKFDRLLKGDIQYSFKFREAEYRKSEKEKYDYLKGETISLSYEDSIKISGRLVEVEFPYVLISLEEESLGEEHGYQWIDAKCELKGEKDKIKRLSETTDVIFGNKTHLVPNRRMISALRDSSAAKIEKQFEISAPDVVQLQQEISQNQLSSSLNSKQFEAVVKSLLAPDIFMIQGPPGTGKSTAIAEIVWQHIRKNQFEKEKQFRVLVTSETNLAVDNALDKLRASNHVLLKPLRFGSSEKLDKEGRFYALGELNEWKEGSDSGNRDNIIEHWIKVVANRSSNAAKLENKEPLDKWHNWLLSKNQDVRSVFYLSYIDNVNVIGATCSSIGKVSSSGNFTRFFQEYCEVFSREDYIKFHKNRNKQTAAPLFKQSITFDLVVQDEASKATPPELALPCLFGKKAVIIGDHRQLPPISNVCELIDDLTKVKAESEDERRIEEVSNLIKFVQQNQVEFNKSHFERLFMNIDSSLKTSFDTQYRMHPGINSIIQQFYLEDGGLKCGIKDEIANSTDLSHPLSRYHGMTKSEHTHVVWIDTKSPELLKGTSRYNLGEVDVIDRLLAKFNSHEGYHSFIEHWRQDQEEEKQIGIITFYGAQTNELKKLESKYPMMPLRVSPVDRFQGMERNVIIVSLVRSNCIAQSPGQAPDNYTYGDLGYPSQSSLGFAEFPNRLNVALSRAKRLLVIVGNSEHFRTNEVYEGVYKAIQESPYGRVMSSELLS